ncbi:MAG: glycosyltransferase family 39 protein [Nitrososphaerota archaeon]|jgi:4-amino-4-deoxy-L-arabinose transferase-like glycosyltransferase|uniref:glycosyltransferase family 39 protein n=1 Tax=Candidatus Bathycorpusculum sp. TaxID=2994959 RepID=UPI00282E6C43|nr:glycosyltransferase family 39 protein [Candidatus Termitimicrobium sp.]MCL2431416.1 glycosyltransferase family 39 protein [Candidatus Termitimicrobium sp.]MDR0493516.1 glycosyltransferase family 39 protein [Nitrososphaerota archaeon]
MANLKAALAAHYPIIGILLGSLLITSYMGTYTNWDAQLEYEAATSVLTHGFPYLSTGLMINQPPLGFYIAALFFGASSLSYLNGVWLATAFGLGSVFLLYVLGNVMYGRRTGLVAAALFGMVPWHTYLTRIFLIDNQYLFLGLLFLIMGILAVKRNSQKLVFGAGIVFATALLTKLYAVFMLIPMLLIIYLHRKETDFKLDVKNTLLFVLPSLVLQAVWFGGFANQNFLGVYFNSDFTHPELVAEPVLAFLPIIFVNSAGWFLFLGGFFSLAFAVVYRKRLREFLRLDAVCLGTIGVIMVLDMFLVLGLHLTVPYISAFKYNYSALPFFCLLAASLIDKSGRLIAYMDHKKDRLIVMVLGAIGLVMLFASLIESVLFLNYWWGFVSFGVDSVTYYGLNVFSEAMERNLLVVLHFGVLILVALCMVLPSLIVGLRRFAMWLRVVLSS